MVGRDITNITDQTRRAVLEAMADGYSKGQGPRQIALDVVGRIGDNGRRTGGIVGLNAPQARAVISMRSRLSSGDLKSVLSMTKRDRRFDKTIRKHIENGTTPTSKQIERWTGRYSDRLLKLRGDTIARFETAQSVEMARVDGFRQGMKKRASRLHTRLKNGGTEAAGKNPE